MRYWFVWLALRMFDRNRFWLCIPNPGCNHSWRLLFVPKDWGQDNGPSRVLASGLTDKSDIAKLCESYGIYPEY